MQKGKSICWQIITVVFLLGLSSSCQPILKAMMGINETIIVYWNKFIGSQSKRLIKTVNDYRENVNSNACMYFVNTDNFFYMMNQDTSKTK